MYINIARIGEIKPKLIRAFPPCAQAKGTGELFRKKIRLLGLELG